MLYSDKLEQKFTLISNSLLSIQTQVEDVCSKQSASIYERIEELKFFAEEDESAPPLASSEEAMLYFFSLFNICEMPEITLSDDGCYYVRIINGQNKLVLRFLADQTIHYLIENSAAYIEEINTIAFFKSKYYDLVRESVFND